MPRLLSWISLDNLQKHAPPLTLASIALLAAAYAKVLPAELDLRAFCLVGAYGAAFWLADLHGRIQSRRNCMIPMCLEYDHPWVRRLIRERVIWAIDPECCNYQAGWYQVPQRLHRRLRKFDQSRRDTRKLPPKP